MDKKELELALDFSGPYVNLAVYDGNEVITASKLMQRREAAAMTDFISDVMEEEGLNLADVKRFTVGSGPGSFTGMRIAAAWVSGYTFGKAGIISRCIPGAFAIAQSAKLGKNENAAIIFDGRNREVILFEVIRNDGDFSIGREAILNKEQSESYFKENNFDRYFVLQYDVNAVKLIINDEIFSRLEEVVEVEAKNLLAESLGEFDCDLTKLHYIRPSVTTN